MGPAVCASSAETVQKFLQQNPGMFSADAPGIPPCHREKGTKESSTVGHRKAGTGPSTESLLFSPSPSLWPLSICPFCWDVFSTVDSVDPPSCHLDRGSVLHSGVIRISLLFSLGDVLSVLEACYHISP